MSTLLPNAIWRMSNVLLQKAVFEPSYPGQESWAYASSESPRHEAQVNAWLASRGISPDTRVFLVRGPDRIDALTWSELMEQWQSCLAGEDVRIVDRDFSWIVDYRKESIVRFGRLSGRISSNQAVQETADPPSS